MQVRHPGVDLLRACRGTDGSRLPGELVQCLARAGEAGRATELFERTTAYANDLGLLSEMADARTGELLGNFPQAFSHVGLVNAAWSLAETQGES